MNSATLTAPHAVGDNAFTVFDTEYLPSLFPFQVYVQHTNGTRTVFNVTGLSGNVYTTTVASGTDFAMPAETPITLVFNSQTQEEIAELLTETFDGYGRPISFGSAPTIAAGSGAGTSPTGPTIASPSNDVAGKISLTAGTSPATSAVIATVTFNKPYSVAPKSIALEPASAAAAAALANVYVSSITTTGFVISSGASGLTAASVYAWTYSIQG